jgi:hypothetical protein
VFARHLKVTNQLLFLLLLVISGACDGQVMRGEADPLELYDGEDDDEDFELDWDELMRTNFDNPIDEGEYCSEEFCGTWSCWHAL